MPINVNDVSKVAGLRPLFTSFWHFWASRMRVYEGKDKKARTQANDVVSYLCLEVFFSVLPAWRVGFFFIFLFPHFS